MAYIAVSAGENFHFFRPESDQVHLMLMNTDTLDVVVQLQLRPTIDPGQMVPQPFGAVLSSHWNLATKSYSFTEDDGTYLSVPILLKAGQSSLFFLNFTHRLEGFLKIVLPSKVVVMPDGTLRNKAQSNRAIAIGYQLSYCFDVTSRKGDEVIDSRKYNIVTQPAMFTTIQPDSGDKVLNFMAGLAGGKSKTTDKEVISYINSLSKDVEAGQREVGSFVRMATMMGSNEDLREHFNALLDAHGLHFNLSSTLAQGSSKLQNSEFSNPSSTAIGPKQDDPTPPPPAARDFLRALMGMNGEDAALPPVTPAVRQYMRELLGIIVQG